MAHFLRIGFFTFLLCLSFLFTSFNDLFDIIENDCSSHFLKGEGERDLIPMNQFEILHSHVNYAAAAYCRNDQLKNWTCGSRCVGEVIIEKFFHDNLKGACGYIAYNKKSKSIIIAFRGSQDLANWAYNLEFALLDYEFPGVEGALVHRGIYEVYDRVKSSILWNIQWMMMREENSCRGYDIIVTGHSL
ncbi:2105_t:CDS:2, partial [Diversispora eburnea]